VNQDDD